ncbi:carbohydrate ABC transporter permease [Streptomyces sp. NPDC020917]|uniref:carbohydrate ABC transporter permease n=1 Tax=Streptomyces sp. NPDC020917 TaxID=3365102 RepID=UPI003792C50C
MSELLPSSARHRRATARKALNTAALAVVALIFTAPFIWTVLTALKPEDEIFNGRLRLFGSRIMWSNFSDAWQSIPFGRFVVNSVLVAGLGTLVNVIVSVLSAYAFSRFRFRSRDRLFLLFLATMLLPSEALVVPLFILVQKLGLVNSYAALVLPAAFAPFGAFLLRQFMLSMPSELEDAARIDGAGRLRVLVSVILPLIRPTVAVLAVFTFVSYWGSYLWPLIIVNDQGKATVPLGLSMFTSQYGTQWSLLMAGCVISIVPSLVMLVLLQRHLIKGIASSGFGGR